jgi:hypothetical protein
MTHPELLSASEVSYVTAYRSSLLSFACFVAMFLSFAALQTFPQIIYLSTVLAIAFHVALLPIVAAIPAIGWTRVGGYTWVVADIILAVAGLNGVPIATIEPLRFGVHVALVMWPIGIAFANSGFLRWASWGFAITTGTVPLLGTLVPPSTRFIGMPFVVLWYVAIILALRRAALASAVARREQLADSGMA